ncbi:hypothetical protein DSECCO2_621920 [anaerobic digester metagenome]
MIAYIIERDLINKDANIITHIFLYGLIFLMLYALLKCIISLLNIVKKECGDNKRSYENRFALKKYFYQKILNDITMALSLIKRCTEKEEDSKLDDDIQKIYFYEAYYYFELAMDSLNKKNIFEFPSKDRQCYDDFLIEMNPSMVINTLDICVKALENLIKIANDKEQSIDGTSIIEKVDLLKEQYHTTYINVVKQMDIIKAKREEEGEKKSTAK